MCGSYGSVAAVRCLQHRGIPLGSINGCNINHKLSVLDKTSLKSCNKLSKSGSLLTLRHSLCVRLKLGVGLYKSNWLDTTWPSISVHMVGTQASYSYLSMTITFLTYRRVTYAGATSFLRCTVWSSHFYLNVTSLFLWSIYCKSMEFREIVKIYILRVRSQ